MIKLMLRISTVGMVILFIALSAHIARADSKYDYISYPELETLLTAMEQTAKTKPANILRLEVFGRTYSGTPLYAVKFSGSPDIDDESKPDVLLCNGIHGNEWLPSELSIRFMQYLFDSYYDTTAAGHEEVRDLINKNDIWIIPILNPDGRNRDEGEVKDGDPEEFTAWRKNVQPVVCPEDPDALGIDLNRTFSDGFAGPKPAYGCSTQGYNGEVPFAAPESRWIRNFANNHMITLSMEGHTTLQAVMSAGGDSANGNFIRLFSQVSTWF